MIGYNPTNWASGDVITSEKLNKLEKGVANYSFEITLTSSGRNWTSNLSYDQISEILSSNGLRSRAMVTVKKGSENSTTNMLVFAQDNGVIAIISTPHDDPEFPIIYPQVLAEPKFIGYTIPAAYFIYKDNNADVVAYRKEQDYYATISENPPE